ncbi:MAG: DUF5335 family protein [Burkholderiaceae bacterium]
MTTRKIEKAEWKTFFDSVSKVGGLDSKCAEIEVLGLSLGDHIAAEWVPMFGVTYNPRGDMLEIALEGLDHLIHKPQMIFVEENTAGLLSISVTDEDDIQHIIRLRDPLLLPGKPAP